MADLARCRLVDATQEIGGGARRPVGLDRGLVLDVEPEFLAGSHEVDHERGVVVDRVDSEIVAAMERGEIPGVVARDPHIPLALNEHVVRHLIGAFRSPALEVRVRAHILQLQAAMLTEHASIDMREGPGRIRAIEWHRVPTYAHLAALAFTPDDAIGVRDRVLQEVTEEEALLLLGISGGYWQLATFLQIQLVGALVGIQPRDSGDVGAADALAPESRIRRVRLCADHRGDSLAGDPAPA